MPSNLPKLEQLGLQEPRVRTLPLSRVGSLVDDILDISDLAGIHCDPWQESSLEAIASVDAFGQWAATEFGELVSRQQGKGGILLPYELAHLYLWPREDGAPKLIGHTAHEGATAREAFRRARRAILGSPVNGKPRRALRYENALGHWRPGARGSLRPGIRSWCLIQRAPHRRWLARVTRR